MPRTASALVLLLAGVASAALPGLRAPDGLKPAKGRLLVATPQVGGPFFAKTAVLLLEYDASGAIGVIVNKPTGVALAKLLPDEAGLAERPDQAFLGGPVGGDTLWVVFRSAEPVEGAVPIRDDIQATTRIETLRALLRDGLDARHLRAFVGYAGWGMGQLDGELARGDWYVDEGAPEWVFSQDPGSVWPELIARNAGVRTRAPSPGVGTAGAPVVQRAPTTYAIQAGSSGAFLRRVKTPLPSSVLLSVPSQ